MATLDKLLKEKATAIAKDPQKMKTVGEWIRPAYKGKVIVLATPEKAYHVVFTRDSVTVRKGDYPSCETRYNGSEQDLVAVLTGETNAYLGAKSDRLVMWGNLNDATVFERLL